MPQMYRNIPAFLKQQQNWVVWGIKGAPQKSPYNPMALLSGKNMPARAGIRETWGNYQAATKCVMRGLAQGVGYEFDGRVHGVDLDHVLNRNTLSLQAFEIVEKLASYTEISPSGNGLHVFVFAPGAVIKRHRAKDTFVEIYCDKRYFTVTGNLYGNADTIESRTAELQEIHDNYLMPKPCTLIAPHPITTVLRPGRNQFFLNIGLERDKKIAALWAGNRRYGNESSDDMALMNKLAYWCNADLDAMIHAFLSSPYHAQKNEFHKKKCRRPDYLINTANKACVSVYSTASMDYKHWITKSKERYDKSTVSTT